MTYVGHIYLSLVLSLDIKTGSICRIGMSYINTLGFCFLITNFSKSNLAPSIYIPEMYLPFFGLLGTFDESVNVVTLVSIVNLSNSSVFCLQNCWLSATIYDYGMCIPDNQVQLGSHLIHSLYCSILLRRWIIHDASFLLVWGDNFFQASGMNPLNMSF